MSEITDPGASLSREDISELTKHAERDAPLVLARDWDAMAAAYEPDAVRMPPGAPAIRGRPAIRNALETTPPLDDFEFEMVDLQGNSGLAYMSAEWRISVVPPGEQEPVKDAGKILIVFRKQADGTWLRAVDVWNSGL